MTVDPWDELKAFIIIIKVYALMSFEIKNDPSCIDGARHSHTTIRRSRCLADELKKSQFNAATSWAVQNNSVMEMLTDERPDLLALTRPESGKVRSFRVSVHSTFNVAPIDLFFNHTTIDLQKNQITEPPITIDIDDDALLTTIL